MNRSIASEKWLDEIDKMREARHYSQDESVLNSLLAQSQVELQNARLIGAGRDSLVYSCFEKRMERRVAVRFLRPQFRQSRRRVDRFVNGGQLNGQIHHEHFAQVYSRVTLSHDGEALEGFVIQEVIHPNTLDHFYWSIAGNGRCYFELAVRKLLPVVDALVMMHEEHRISHNDLSLQNILFEMSSSNCDDPLTSSACNKCWIVDSGLLKQHAPDASVVEVGRADVRKLCETMCAAFLVHEVLPPTQYDAFAPVRQFSTEDLLDHAVSSNSRIPRRLLRILQKGVSAADGYDTARELQEDLQSFLNDRPLQHARGTRLQQNSETLFLWWKRYPWRVGLFSALIAASVALGITVIALLSSWAQASKEREFESYKDVLASLERGAPDAAHDTLHTMDDRTNLPWRFLNSQVEQNLFRLPRRHGPVVDMEFSATPDRLWLLNQSGTIYQFDPGQRKLERVDIDEFDCLDPIGLSVSQTGTLAAVVNRAGDVTLLSLKRNKELARWTGVATSCAISPDGELLAFNSIETYMPTVSLVKLSDLSTVTQLKFSDWQSLKAQFTAATDHLPHTISFSPDSSLITISTRAYTAIWEVATSSHSQVISHSNSSKSTSNPAWTENGSLIVSGNEGRVLAELAPPFDRQNSITIASSLEVVDHIGAIELFDGRIAYAGQALGPVAIVDKESGRVLWQFSGHAPGRVQIRGLAANKSGSLLAMAFREDIWVRRWDEPKVRPSFVSVAPSESRDWSVSSDGKRVADIAAHSVITIRETADPASQIAEYALDAPGEFGLVRFLANDELGFITVNPSATSPNLQDICFGTTRQGEFRREQIQIHRQFLDSRVSDLSGQTPASLCMDAPRAGKLFPFMIAAHGNTAGFLIDEFEVTEVDFKGPVLGLWYMESESVFLVSTAEAGLQKWQRHTDGRWEPTPRTYAERAAEVAAFAPNGQQIALAGSDGVVRICDIGTFTVERRLTGHLGPVTALTFSSDSAFVLSGQRDGTVIVWSVEQASEAFRFNTPPGLMRLDVDSLGKHIYSCHADGSLSLWALNGRGNHELFPKK